MLPDNGCVPRDSELGRRSAPRTPPNGGCRSGGRALSSLAYRTLATPASGRQGCPTDVRAPVSYSGQRPSRRAEHEGARVRAKRLRTLPTAQQESVCKTDRKFPRSRRQRRQIGKANRQSGHERDGEQGETPHTECRKQSSRRAALTGGRRFWLACTYPHTYERPALPGGQP